MLISVFIAGPDLPTWLQGHSMVTLGLGQAVLGGSKNLFPNDFQKFCRKLI